MDEKTVTMITDYLDKIAEKLGVGIGKVWPWFIQQQYIEVYYPLMLSVVSGISFYFCLKYTLKHWNPKEGYNIENHDHEGAWVCLNGVLGTLTFFVFIVFLIELEDIFNPEYHALMDIIRMAK